MHSSPIWEMIIIVLSKKKIEPKPSMILITVCAIISKWVDKNVCDCLLIMQCHAALIV